MLWEDDGDDFFLEWIECLCLVYGGKKKSVKLTKTITRRITLSMDAKEWNIKVSKRGGSETGDCPKDLLWYSNIRRSTKETHKWVSCFLLEFLLCSRLRETPTRTKRRWSIAKSDFYAPRPLKPQHGRTNVKNSNKVFCTFLSLNKLCSGFF